MNEEKYFLLKNNLKQFESNNLIIWRSEYKNFYTYKNVIEVIERIIKVFNDFEILSQNKICINVDHSPILIPVILSIINHECSFCPINPTSNKTEIIKCMENFQTKYLLSEFLLENDNNLLLKISIDIFQRNLYIYVLNLDLLNFTKPRNLCYSIQTSGTTGESKIVHVPFDCILPNIINLSKRFEIVSNDIIFISSPPTFDPFIVDIFLAIKNGAALLLTSKSNRLSVQNLVNILFPNDIDLGATILQITPSLFTRFDFDIIEKRILSETSSLRILILGGEQFPSLDVVKKWQNWFSIKRKRIFNIYGITEVSCWSTLEEITNETEEISIGEPIDFETILEIRNHNSNKLIEGIGELFIGSSIRKCAINNEPLNILNDNKIQFRSTGDLVELKNKKYYFKGRLNDVIKRYGRKVNLKKIENTFKSDKNVKNISCIFDNKTNKVLLFIVGENVRKENLYKSSELEEYERPDDIIILESLPLSSHGKISKIKLLQYYTDKKKSREINLIEMFLEKLQENLENLGSIPLNNNDVIKRKKTQWDMPFLLAGGTSFLALNLLSDLETQTNQSLPNILKMLLDNKTSLYEIYIKLQKTLSINSENQVQNDLNTNDYELKIVWKYNLEKCVDASPTIGRLLNDKSVISVGSHSHLLVNLDSETGQLISFLKLLDRIEGQVTIVNNVGFVGCYNGRLYKFQLETGLILWEYKSGDMIKCKPYVDDFYVIFGNYGMNMNLFCLNNQNGDMKWSIKLGDRGILSSPLKINDDNILICTLDGICALIQIRTGTIGWQIILNSPIFSTAKLFKDNYILIAEVNGLIHCHEWMNGLEHNTFKIDGTIFSSFEIIENYIIFGCHDKKLYCLEFKYDKFNLKWTLKMQSQIYSTPKLLQINNKDFLVCCSTNGFLNIIENDRKLCTLKLNGEIFSTPTINMNKIYIGCRDNNLYCIEFLIK